MAPVANDQSRFGHRRSLRRLSFGEFRESYTIARRFRKGKFPHVERESLTTDHMDGRDAEPTPISLPSLDEMTRQNQSDVIANSKPYSSVPCV